MKCSYRECQHSLHSQQPNINLPAGAVVRMTKKYCSDECRNKETVAEYIDARRTGSERRSSSYPVNSRTFGAALVKEGKINSYQLEKALELKTMNGKRPLAYYLIKKGWIARRELLTSLARYHDVPFISLGNRPQASLLSAQFPFSLLFVAGVVPFAYSAEQNTLCLAMKDPSDLSAVVAIKTLNGSHVKVFQGDPEEIDGYLATIRDKAMLEGLITTAASAMETAVAV